MCPLYFVFILKFAAGETLKGHQQPLGSHAPPLGVTFIGKFSSPGVFYENFVKESQPLLMKSPLLDTPFPAFEKWTDDFLREEYGSEVVSVEQSKKEKRNLRPSTMTLHEFLDLYQKKNVYMVQSLPSSMKDDVHLPITLQCGGTQHVLHDAVLWMSSGGTKSVLHSDKLDNLLCVLSGTKDVILIDKAHQSDVEAHGFVQEGTYSTVDVDSVNLQQYPRLKAVPWHRAHLEAGDCIYIPYKWYHQINSGGGDKNRNVAVNYWFSHRWWHNATDCRAFHLFNITEPLSKFTFASPNEQIRSHILEPFSEMDSISKADFVSVFLAEATLAGEFFHYISKNQTTEVLSWAQLYAFDIDDAVMKFPELFAAGVKLQKEKVHKKKPKKEPIKVQDDFQEESDRKINIPMITPDDEEFEKMLEEVAKHGGSAHRTANDERPVINDVKVKVTSKGQKQETKLDTDKEKGSSHRHDEF
ncbi:bifunctional peptidase and arginyl-hydroxylase JMJD5-like [Haliotis cracherodii]|uniref:bifunctional peptidase and arginyl-hydroxylase JMJD5-like n=1 Tax=Haliotis cracherodii TaxID=6455 RepID=UPI0039E77D7F